MRVVQIVPGAGGGFYCQNCLRDFLLVKALRQQGHDVMVVPMYLPLVADEPGMEADAPLFFGAVKTYLRQTSAMVRIAPEWFIKLLDSPRLLAYAARKAGSTRAGDLEGITLSLLAVEDGPHERELDDMLSWIGKSGRIDVVHLSNAMLIGLAGRIKARLGAKVVCTVQDEDSWIDAMRKTFADEVWRTIAAKSAHVDAFISVSRSYAGVMARRSGIPESKIHVVYPGLEVADFPEAPLLFRPPTVGFISRMSESLGLGALMGAFVQVRKDRELKHTRLRITGGSTEDDADFLAGLKEGINEAGMGNDVDFLPAFDRNSRIAFYQTLSVLSTPVPRGEALGLQVLEAMASGVPVVLPDIGGYSELVEATGGGMLYDAGDANMYAETLKLVLSDPDKARKMGRNAREVVRNRFTPANMAAETLKVYEGV